MKTINDELELNRKAVKAAFWFTVCNILQRGIQFLYTPLYTRILSAEGYGKYSAFLTWSNIISVFATLNLCYATFANGMMEFKNQRREYLYSMIGLTFSLSTLFFALLYPINNSLQKYTGIFGWELFVMYIAVFFQMVVLLWSAFERFEFRYKRLILVTLVVSILNPLMSVGLYEVSQIGSDSFIIGYAFSYFAVGMIIIFRMISEKVMPYNRYFWKFAISFSVPLIPHYLSNSILNQSDRIMIKYFYGDRYAGVYTLAYQVSLAISILYLGINNSFSPWTYRMIDEQKNDRVKDAIRSILIPSAYLSLGVMLFSPEIVLILGNEEFLEAVTIIPDLVVATYIMFLNMLILNVLFFYKKNMWVVLATIMGAISNVLLNCILLPRFGYRIAALTTVVGFVVIFLTNCISVIRIKSYLFPIKEALVSIFSLLLFGKIVGYINDYISFFAYRLALFVMGIAVILIFYKKKIFELFKRKQDE